MQNIHDDLNESMELERQKIATRYLRVCIEPLWGVETPWYIFYASLLVLTDWVTRNSIMENVRQAMAIGFDCSKLKSKFKSMYSMRILLLCRVPIEVEEFSTWSISKLSQLLPCFRWGRCGDFASEQKFLVVINILGGWHFQLIFVREGGCPYFFVCFFLLLFSNPFRNPSCSKIDQSPIIFSFAFLPQDEKKTLWRNNMFFFFSTKSSLKELFSSPSTDVFHRLFHCCLLLTPYWKAIIAIIRTSCTCVGQSSQSSEFVTLALGNHCNH